MRPDELEEVLVTVYPHPSPTMSLRVAVKARGEWIEPPLSWPVTGDDDQLWGAEVFAAELYDRLATS